MSNPPGASPPSAIAAQPVPPPAAAPGEPASSCDDPIITADDGSQVLAWSMVKLVDQVDTGGYNPETHDGDKLVFDLNTSPITEVQTALVTIAGASPLCRAWHAPWLACGHSAGCYAVSASCILLCRCRCSCSEPGQKRQNGAKSDHRILLCASPRSVPETRRPIC